MATGPRRTRCCMLQKSGEGMPGAILGGLFRPWGDGARSGLNSHENGGPRSAAGTAIAGIGKARAWWMLPLAWFISGFQAGLPCSLDRFRTSSTVPGAHFDRRRAAQVTQ